MLQHCNSLLRSRQYLFQKALFSTATAKKPNCAVILSGCGVYDGTEIQESTATLFSLSRRGKVQCFAPNINQMHVINHTDGSEMNETRNVLVESARICRGNIKDLKELDCDNYDCLLVPGGFGAAKNLCSFAVDGINMSINDEVERVIKEFHTKSKPMGLCCISPVIAAKIFAKQGVQVTVGNDADNENGDWPHCGTAAAIEEMGATHFVRGAEQVYVDEKNKIVTSAAYMYNGEPGDIFQSVNAMCDAVLKLVNYNDL